MKDARKQQPPDPPELTAILVRMEMLVRAVWHLGIAHGIMGALKESPAEAGKEGEG